MDNMVIGYRKLSSSGITAAGRFRGGEGAR
jgi:hypothetical protein